MVTVRTSPKGLPWTATQKVTKEVRGLQLDKGARPLTSKARGSEMVILTTLRKLMSAPEVAVEVCCQLAPLHVPQQQALVLRAAGHSDICGVKRWVTMMQGRNMGYDHAGSKRRLRSCWVKTWVIIMQSRNLGDNHAAKD